MNLIIKEINDDFLEIDKIKEFLYSQIKRVWYLVRLQNFTMILKG